MALIHEQVYSRNMNTRIELGVYLRDLVEHLKNLYRESASGVRFICEVDPISLPVEKAVPCGLAVHECVVNSLKHAFSPVGGCKEIRIGGEKSGGTLVLEIADNGRGLYGTSLRRGGEAVSSGKDLIILLVERQLKGSVGIEGNEGTRWTLRFPI